MSGDMTEKVCSRRLFLHEVDQCQQVFTGFCLLFPGELIIPLQLNEEAVQTPELVGREDPVYQGV